jgi:cell division septation protein DedD
MMQPPERSLSLLLLAVVIGLGCTPSNETGPPSSQKNTAATDRADRADKREDGSAGPAASGAERAASSEARRSEYTVQVGIFNLKEDAKKRAYDLRAQNVSNFIQQDGERWRVCVGRFSSEERAKRVESQLKAKRFNDATVIALVN